MKRTHALLALALAALAAAPAWADSNTANRGYASYYSYSGRTASGERADPEGLTAAHRSLPFGTRVRVTEPRSGRWVVVRINDRGPFVRGRIIDLSLGAARALGITGQGVALVQIEVVR